MLDSEDRRSLIKAFGTLLKRATPDSDGSARKYDEGNAHNGKTDITTHDYSNAKRERHEHYHRVQEKIFWVSYIVVTIGALVAAGAAAFYAKGAYSQAKRQADYAERGSPRAWIYVQYPPNFHTDSTNPVLMGDPKGSLRSFRVEIPVWFHNFGQLPGTVETFFARLIIQRTPEIEPRNVIIDPKDVDDKKFSVIDDNGFAKETIEGRTLAGTEDLKPVFNRFFEARDQPNVLWSPNGLSKWLWVVIKYRDPFGVDRETSSFIHIVLGMDVIVVNDPRYNYEH